MATYHEHSNEHQHEPTPPKAKGLRRAGSISLVKGFAFGALALFTKNPPLAVISGHDIGDKLAFSDEAHASESHDPYERATLMRRAANKILWLTIAAGGAELMLEAFSPVGHNDLLGLAGNASSLGLDIVARHYVKHDEHHSHNEIGHTHTDMDVRVSSVGLAGNVIATATHQHWVLFPVAFYGIAKAAQSVRSIRKHATSIENHN